MPLRLCSFDQTRFKWHRDRDQTKLSAFGKVTYEHDTARRSKITQDPGGTKSKQGSMAR